MDLDNNNEELKAIKELEKAFKNCSKLGIKFSVMDADLLFVNKRAYKECYKFELTQGNSVYPTVAYMQDIDNSIQNKVNTNNSMESCGGW